MVGEDQDGLLWIVGRLHSADCLFEPSQHFLIEPRIHIQKRYAVEARYRRESGHFARHGETCSPRAREVGGFEGFVFGAGLVCKMELSFTAEKSTGHMLRVFLFHAKAGHSGGYS